jgi:peptidoglycan-N-acetylglucosamine deacetylase
MYIVKTPNLIQPLVSHLMWCVHTFDKEIFLTFDDGPTPEVTEQVLDILKQYNAKATFFCLGKNVASHPQIFNRLISEGHAVGNHTYDHPNGRKTNHYTYLKSVVKAEEVFQTNYFRPPYGQITRGQIAALKNKYQIVMWDIITGDFDPTITEDKVVKNVLDYARRGSIVVFHDSVKAAPRMIPALKIVMQELHSKGYAFSALPSKPKN